MRRLRLKLLHAWDRWRLRRIAARHPGLDIHPTASANFAHATFELAPGARVQIGANVVTERRKGGVYFALRENAEVVIGEGCWLRSDRQSVHLVVYENARMQVDRRVFLNGCQLSAKSSVHVGEGSMIGPGTRVYDADQHPFDSDTPERIEAVEIGAEVWVASDATILRGVRIGDESIVGARSVVTRSLPEHSLAAGAPAKVVGTVGDRRSVRVL